MKRLYSAMSKKNTVTLGEAIQEMVKTFKLGPKINEASVKMLWPKLMGAPIARYTTDISLNGNKLYIHISSAALKNELQYSRDKVRSLLNQELGADVIKDVFIL